MEWEILNITEDLSLTTSSCKVNDSHSTFDWNSPDGAKISEGCISHHLGSILPQSLRVTLILMGAYGMLSFSTLTCTAKLSGILLEKRTFLELQISPNHYEL